MLAPDRIDEWATSLPLCFAQGKNYKYPLNRKLGGPNSHSGHFGEKRNLVSCQELKPRSFSTGLHVMVPN